MLAATSGERLSQSLRARSREFPFAGRVAISGAGFAAVTLLIVIAAVVTVSVASGVLYHAVCYGSGGPVAWFAIGGLLVGLFYLLPRLGSDRLSLERVIDAGPDLSRPLVEWLAAFAIFSVVLVLSKAGELHSRGWLIVFFLGGLVVMPAVEFAVRNLAQSFIRQGMIEPRRVFLVGTRIELQRLVATIRSSPVAKVVGVRELSPDATASARAQLLEDGVASARSTGAEDVVLVMPGDRQAMIAETVEAFSVLPVAIHLDVSTLERRFGALAVHRLGALSALALDPAPLSPIQRIVKRTFDILVSGTALILLAPLMAAIAVLIVWDSPGGVFYRQRRRGYNQREFVIMKFRSMRSDPVDEFRQAARDDPRVTRVGRWLRRTNLDELPQLINVLKGEMSIVGPRPHAVAHDQQFEDKIRRYPRRLNVRPGITGWAQINGLRGETDTYEKMALRVSHDLYYIDHWSLWFDLFIVAATIVSPKSYRNAR